MGFNTKDIKKELFDAALITAGVAAVGFASKKVAGDPLGTPGTFKGTLKLGVAVATGIIGVIKKLGGIIKKFRTKSPIHDG